MPTAQPLPLRPRQKDALKALTDAIAAGKERVTVVSACGTGKTHTASAAADHLAPDGAVLVAVPHPGTADADHRALAAGRTQRINGQRLLHHLRHPAPPIARGAHPIPAPSGRLLRHARAGHRLRHLRIPSRGSRANQLRLPAWDLIVAEEAHRTCTDAPRGWGIVHDNHAPRAVVQRPRWLLR